jgi:hypothetical protein
VGFRVLVGRYQVARKDAGKDTYSKQSPTLLLSFFKLRFLFIALNALDVISQ